MRAFWSGFLGSVAGIVAAIACLGLAGAFALSSILAGLVQTDAFNNGAPESGRDSGAVLEIDLRASEFSPVPAFDMTDLEQARRFARTLGALERASFDSRIQSVRVLVGLSPLSAGRSEELAGALARVSSAGKPVIAHVQRDEHSQLQALAAVAGADQIHANRLGLLSIHPPQTRLQPGADMPTSALAPIASARGLETSDLQALFGDGAITMETARQAGLIDAFQSLEALRAGTDRSGAQTLSLDRYIQAQHPPASNDGVGLVMLAGVTPEGARGERAASMNTDQLAAAIDDAVQAPQIRAIVVRIESRNVQYTGAEQLAAAIRRARQAGKPVVASLSSTVEGPAYYVAAAADRIIIPSRATLGRIAGGHRRGPDGSDAGETFRSAAEAELRTLVYTALADARDLPEARIRALADGQVWTGGEAVDFGLADQIGGLHDAVVQAGELAGVSSGRPPTLVEYPRPPDRLETLLRRVSNLLSLQARPEAARR